MEPQSVLIQTPQTPTLQPEQRRGWIRFFFHDEETPDSRSLVDLQRRALWVCLALIFQSLNEIGQFINVFGESKPAFLLILDALLPPALTLGSFWTLWMACRPARMLKQRNSRRAERLHLVLWQRIVMILMPLMLLAGIIIASSTLILCFFPQRFSNDGTSLGVNAASLLLQGRNPYTDSNIVDVARQFAIQPNWTTPLRQGQFANALDYPSMDELNAVFKRGLETGAAPELESRVSYPALSFLTLVPFVLFQHYNVLPLSLVSYLVIVSCGCYAARPALRPWILLLALANVPMWSSILGGNFDILTYLFIIMSWLLCGRSRTSALFLGLALASKQIAWFFVPFYMVMIWRTEGLKSMLGRVTLAGVVALVINLPFILWNPAAWYAGVLAPLLDPMFPFGVGLVNLGVTHLLPYFPARVYQVLEAGVFCALLAYYWRIGRWRPEAAMLLAVVPLFFAWRSLPSYFYCTAFPLFMLMAARGTFALRLKEHVSG
jgi:hypothetical protein